MPKTSIQILIEIGTQEKCQKSEKQERNKKGEGLGHP